MSKQSIKATIDANIKQNGAQAITGQIMNSVLNQMVDNLAEEASTTEKLTELESELLEKIITRFDAPDVVFDGYSNGNILYNSNLVLPVGYKLKKVILKNGGEENTRGTTLVIINANNAIEKTINLGIISADTEVDVSAENIIIQAGYKYCVGNPSNKWGRGSVSGYYIFSNGSFTEYNDYYFGFGFETELVVNKLETMRAEYTDGISGNRDRLDEIEIKGVGANLFNKYDENIIKDKAFDKATGNIVDLTNAFITGFIPVEYGKKYSFTDNTSFLGSTYNRSVSLYDENKNFVRGYFYEVTHSDNVINTFTNALSSAKYARVVGYYSNIGSFMFVEGDALPEKYTSFGQYKYLNPTLFPNDYQFIRMFRKIAGIGDSLMSGCIQKTRTDAHDFNNVSWLSFISYDSGAVATHYSTGGYTAKNWIDGNGGHKEKLASDPKSWAYFIGFGTNDADSSKASYPLGSIEDIAGADSFVGYYKQIVEYVHAQAPNAKIFCMSTYKRTEPYGEMVGEIAKLYDYCYFIDIIKCSDVTLMSDSSYVCFDHFSTQGYIALAKNIAKEVNRIITDNMQDFVYIGYDNQL